MTKINHEEYEALKELDDELKWIARDEPGELYVYDEKPVKLEVMWSYAGLHMEWVREHEHLFQFIQWEDEEPYNIQELISDYEYKTGTFDWATALQGVLHGESEERGVTKLETLVVPTDLGEWLQSRGIGESLTYFSTIDALYHYWESIISSPTGSFITDNKKELIEVILGSRGYRVEAPLYCALIKGYELLDNDRFYWIYDKYEESVSVSKLYSLRGDFLTEMSKEEWNELGINDSNAEFIRVDGGD